MGIRSINTAQGLENGENREKNNGRGGGGKSGNFILGQKSGNFLYFRPKVVVFFPEWLNAAISINSQISRIYITCISIP